LFLWRSIVKRPAALRKYQLAPIPSGPFSANQVKTSCAQLRPLFFLESFAENADATAYAHAEPRIDLNVKNTKLAYGAERSNRMDFSDYDRVDDFELNEILWRAVRGVDAPLPPAVRRAIAFRSMTATKK
jgi:hypothetical protein